MIADAGLAAVDDGTMLYRYRWTPLGGPPRAIVHISHGLAEHGGRYDRLGRFLAPRGFAVYAHDHRGHGLTAGRPEALGFFAERGGWARAVEDLRQLIVEEAALHPKAPVILLGHSMGSFMAQQIIEESGSLLAGCALSGSTGRPQRRVMALRILAYLERRRLGPRGRSRLLHRFSLNTANRQFQPVRTDFDWLSRDAGEVEKFVADPFCGFTGTTQLWIDLVEGAYSICRPEHQARIPKELPVYVFAGARDPVSQNTRGLVQLLGAYRRAGLSRVQHRFYAEGRHEMLNELNRDEVMADLLEWLEMVAADAPRSRG